MNFRAPCFCFAFFLLLFSSNLLAQDVGEAEPSSDPWKIKEWKVAASVYTKHWDPEPDHVNNQHLVGLEVQFNNNWLVGAAVFDNSFGQFSQFVFMGKIWQLFGSRYWYVKLMGGLLHGYKEPYEDKIPLNELGVAPAILPAVGLRYKRVFVEANIAGNAALTVTVGFAF